MDLSIKIFAGFMVVLLLIVLGTSLCNSQKFYIKPIKNGIEIRQGRFAPKGEKQLICLAGVKAPEKEQKVYSKTDVYPIIFNYYLNKADVLLAAPGIPDYEGIKQSVHLAEPYAITREFGDAVDFRLNSMAKALLIYKAEIAATSGNTAGLKAAAGFLKQAITLTVDKTETESLNNKIQAIESQIKTKSEPAPAAKHP
jgi:hypothetical protein